MSSPLHAPTVVGSEPPTWLVQIVRAAALQLAPQLTQRGASLAYLRLVGLKDLLQHADQIAREALSQVPSRRIVLVIDCAHEGYAPDKRLPKALFDLSASLTGKEIAFIFNQTSEVFAEQVGPAAARAGVRCAFTTFHSFFETQLRTVLRDGAVSTALKLLNRTPAKRLMCLNYKPRLHRLLALDFLASHYGRDEVIGTFGGAETVAGWPWQRVMREDAADFPGAPEAADLMARVGAFATPVNSSKGAPYSALVYGLPFAEARETFASLVTESEMSDGSIKRFTEKSLKALAVGHPVVVAGNPGTVSSLALLGFDMLEHEIDHSYDSDPNPERRLRAVLKQAKRLGDLDVEARSNFLRRNRDRLENNVRLFDGRLLAFMLPWWSSQLTNAVMTTLADWPSTSPTAD
ncbi:MAG: hypothetical protein AAGF45_01310 [Pseudomonadota bacterium]